MKNTVIAIAMLCMSGVAFAGNGQSSTNTNNANAQTASTAEAANQGNNQNITFTTPANTSSTVTSTNASTVAETVASSQKVSSQAGLDETLRNVPNVNAPPLTTSNDTCMGSSSVGAGWVGMGISVGTTWTDKNCLMLKNSRELWNMGMRAASLARMCMDSLNKKALEQTGFVCPQDEKKTAKK